MALSPDSETDATLSPTYSSIADTTSNSSSSSSSSICPHCYNNIDSTPRKGSQVHPINISNSHVDFKTFKLAANAALKGQFEGFGSYDEAKALLLNWKANDLGLKIPEAGSLIIDETQKLKRVLEDSYSFDTEYFSIPSHSPQSKVQKLLANTIDDLSDKQEIQKRRVLLLVYYNGHGAMKNGKLVWSARSSWKFNSPEYPAISWYDLQGMLETAVFDVLLVLDCCHAAGAITKGTTGTMEVLAGCSREVKAIAPGMGSVLGSPFTHCLIKHLEESATRPQGLLMTELQAFLSLDEVLENQSPNHVVLSGHDNPINLRPILPKRELQLAENLMSPTTKPELKALVAISFRGYVLPKMEEFVRWLNSQYPKEIYHIELEKVSLEGSFNSCSTLTLLAMPISLWAHLNGLSSSFLVGFVKSRNYVFGTYQGVITGLEDKVASIELLKGSPRKGASPILEAERADQPASQNALSDAYRATGQVNEAVEIPLEAETDLKDKGGRKLLSWAARNGREAVVELLLETGKVEVDSKDQYGWTPLSLAAESGHRAVVKLLLETGKVEVNSKDIIGWTPLSLAAMNGHEAVVELLLETGKVEVNSKDITGGTSLSLAARNGHEAVVGLLLKTEKVEADSKDQYGGTPLSLAAESGHSAVVKLLLETEKVEVDSKDQYGGTPLSLAAVSGHSAVVKLLLETEKVEVNSKDQYGWTPLLLAAKNGYEAVVELLLETGKVEVDSKDQYGWMPLSLAAKNGHEAVVKLLRGYLN